MTVNRDARRKLIIATSGYHGDEGDGWDEPVADDGAEEEMSDDVPRITVTRCEIEGCDMEAVASNGFTVLQVCTRCGGQAIRSVT